MNGQLEFAAGVPFEKHATWTPRARKGDPATAHEAASVVAPGNEDLIASIRRWCFSHGPSSHEEIALGLVPDESVSRWRRSTVVTACARAGLTNCGWDFNRRGRRVAIWGVVTQTLDDL